MENEKGLTKTRIGLIVIISIFLLSPVLAWMFYVGIIGGGHEAGQGKNYGELIHPARPLEDIRLVDMNDSPVGRDAFLGLWTMVEIADIPCTETCSENIYNMRQIRLALAQDAYRVQRVVLAEDTAGLAAFLADYPGTLLYQITDDSKPMLDRFPDYTEGGIPSISGRIYIIDPQANLMMQYPHKADASKVLKDLRQLLKATWIRPRT